VGPSFVVTVAIAIAAVAVDVAQLLLRSNLLATGFTTAAASCFVAASLNHHFNFNLGFHFTQRQVVEVTAATAVVAAALLRQPRLTESFSPIKHH